MHMNKWIGMILIAISTLMLVSCQKDLGTDTTLLTSSATTQGLVTSEDTKVMPTSDNDAVILANLEEKMSYFETLDMETGFLASDIRTDLSLYIGGTEDDDLFIEQTALFSLMIGLDEPWMLMNTEETGVSPLLEFYEWIDGDVFLTTAYHGYIETDMLDETLTMEEFYQMGDDSEMTTGYEWPRDAAYDQIDDFTFEITLTFEQFLLMDSSISMMGLDFDELFPELDTQKVTMTVHINTELNIYEISIDINLLLLDEESEAYMSMYLRESFRYDSEGDKPALPEGYTKVGATSREGIYLELTPGANQEILSDAMSDCYFKVELDEGFYVIYDDEIQTGYVKTRLYDEDFTLITGTTLFPIREAGTYYVNFKNISGNQIKMTPRLYQLDPAMVGTPANPILSTQDTITLSDDAYLAFLLDAQANRDGFLVIHDTTQGISGYHPYSGAASGVASFQDDVWNTGNYALYMVYLMQPMAIEFRETNEGFPSTFTWDFIYQKTLTWTYANMPSIHFDEPQHIVFTTNESMQNFKFTIDESQTVVFEFATWYSPCLYANVLIDLYDSEGNMIYNSVLNQEMTLDPGDYFLAISASGIANDYDDFELLHEYIYFVLQKTIIE